MIEVQGLSKSYAGPGAPLVVFRDLSFSLGEGEFLSLMGSSGAGKSTLLNVLGCLDTATQGSYRLAGTEVSGLSPRELAQVRNRDIGFVFQSSHFVDYLDLADNVALPGTYGDSDNGTADRERAVALLDSVGLGERQDHRPSMLSGGERQRAAIARALFNNPGLLLADEPTGNLDEDNVHNVLAIFRRLNREGLAILMVTHDPQVAAQAGRQARLDDGALIDA